MSKSNNNFQKLTPINDVELSIYKDALDFVFENQDVKNVGISGAYSAGKSSVIESYKKLKPNIEFMHISLAYFAAALDDDQQQDKPNENILEGKILNQLIHQIEQTKIPQTNFRVKHQVSSGKLWGLAAIVLLAVLLLLYILNFGAWKNFIISLTPITFRNSLLFTTVPLTAFIAGIIFVGIFAYLLYEIFKIQINKNILKGISVQGNTIEIFEHNEESYFDKYLNEVLYLFENSGKDVIVFEDMDRYNTNQIFQRLREINTLVNNRKKDNDRPLRFFYLIKDDIFINKDRTKFFDFIMPIVPVLDGSNSFDQFIAHFKKGNIYNLFNENFLQDISLYINDMRILKNIYNEFLIYYKRISTTEQDPNKLLAIIIYKNLFPRDFNELQLNQGFVHTLFDKKEDFIKDEIVRLKSEITQLETNIETAENEHLNNEKEIDDIYEYKIRRLSSWDQRIQLLKEERDTRKENIKNKTAKRRNELKRRIALIEISITKLQHQKLYEIINKQNIADIFRVTYTNEIGEEMLFNDVKGSEYFPLIKYLVRYGYIDETYPDYMTYFYENSLSRVDKIFLRSITDEDAKDYGYKLNDPSKVLARLSQVSFEKEEVLNFDLVSYLLNKEDEISQRKILKIMQQLKIRKKYKFIDLYFESGKPLAPFIKTLNRTWPTVFNDILEESNFTDERKKQYAIESLYHTEDDDLEEVDSASVLSSFVSTHKGFLNIIEPKIQRLTDAFELLNIKLEDIDYENSNRELFQMVYQHNFYIINYNLVCLMLKKVYCYQKDIDLKHKNYTIILSKIDEPLVSYVEENIDNYVEEILNHCDDEILDSEKTVIRLLNNGQLKTSLKENYINKLKTMICSIEDVKDTTLWAELLACDLIKYSEKNVLQYFFCDNNGLDMLLVNLINKRGTTFNFDYDAIDSYFEKGSGSKFFYAVIKCEFLAINAYTEILKSLNRYLSNFEIKDISDQKMDVIIKLKIARMNPEVLSFIRENYPKKIISFIVYNIQNYTEKVITDENFDFDEMCEILKTDISDEYKISLLQFTDRYISSLDDAFSDLVKVYILKNNFDEADIPELLKNYNIMSNELKEVIADIAERYIEEIVDNEYYIPIQLCKKMFILNSLPVESKLQLFAIALSNFDELECKESLSILKRDDFLSVFSGKRPAIEITDTNVKILDTMVKKHWIVGYDVDKKNEKMFRVSSKRSVKKQGLSKELL